MPRPPRPSKTPAAAPASGRIVSIDRLRGLAMVVMVLDHAWAYFSTAERYPLNPQELPNTSTAEFLALWLPQFCAPTFVFLAGVGARLQRDRGKEASSLASFLVLRGLLLILLEFTLVHWSVYFNADYRVTIPLILAAIGGAMILFSPFLWLSGRWGGVMGGAIVFGHPLFLAAFEKAFPAAHSLKVLLLQPGRIQLDAGHLLVWSQPLLPWVGMLALGYAAGALYSLSPARRRFWLFAAGLTSLAAFAVLRAANAAGDPHPRQSYPHLRDTAFSFLTATNLPPSPLFGLLGLGVALLGCAGFESWEPRIAKSPLVALETLGRVPLFFYLVQWPVLHLLAVGASWATGRSIDWLFAGFNENGIRPFGWTPASGFPVWVLFAMWVTAVAVAYPLCRRFAELKRTSRSSWLSYF